MARPYRVMMIAPTSFFADYGCHVRILEEARTLEKMGHSVTVVTYANGGNVVDLNIARTLPIPWRQDYEVGSSRHKLLFDALLAAKMTQLTIAGKYDVIHAHLHEGALLGMGLGWLHGLPTVFDFQGSMTEEMIDHHFMERSSAIYKPLRWLEQRIDRSAPVIFTNTINARRLLIDEFGCNPRRLHALPDCVDSDVFRPAESYDADELRALRRSLGVPEGNRVIVYLGLLAEYQGVSHLLEAMRLLRSKRSDVTLLLMGFPGVDVYRAKARDLGIGDDVILTGRIPYGDAPRFLALGDVAVAPKLSLTEGAGKLLNYMAVGLPTVAFETPVAHEYLGEHGYYAVRGDAASLAEQLAAALAQDGEAEQRAAALRTRAVEEFDWRTAATHIVEAYATVCGDTPPAL
jgi:glycosyltransferase involved in cell wall biosynthesis